MAFGGFNEENPALVRIPESFFGELLAQINHLAELKLVLFAFWALEQQTGSVRFLTLADFLADERVMRAFTRESLVDALEKAELDGVLLRADPSEGEGEALFFLNSPKGRQGLRLAVEGKLEPERRRIAPGTLEAVRPNIFRLYEQNIGVLIPLIVDALREAEREFPEDWIREAFQIAVERNVRNWNYVRAILTRWKEEGRETTVGQDTTQNRRKYIQGKYSEFVEH